jgi:hypothetical protein
VVVGEDEASRLAHGQNVRVDALEPEGVVVVASAGALLAIAERAAGVLAPKKVFARG